MTAGSGRVKPRARQQGRRAATPAAATAARKHTDHSPPCHYCGQTLPALFQVLITEFFQLLGYSVLMERVPLRQRSPPPSPALDRRVSHHWTPHTVWCGPLGTERPQALLMAAFGIRCRNRNAVKTQGSWHPWCRLSVSLKLPEFACCTHTGQDPSLCLWHELSSARADP